MKIALLLTFALLIAGCETTPRTREAKTIPAGEKARVGQLVYSVVDSQIVPKLGDDPVSARTPEHRFYIVQVSVSNSGNAEVAIPGMTLVDDSGKTYPELGDGKGVQSWLGVIRRVGPGQTQQGQVVFDAPANHMKLKLTEETDENDIYVDMPLNLAQQVNDATLPQPELSAVPPLSPAGPRK